MMFLSKTKCSLYKPLNISSPNILHLLLIKSICADIITPCIVNQMQKLLPQFLSLNKELRLAELLQAKSVFLSSIWLENKGSYLLAIAIMLASNSKPFHNLTFIALFPYTWHCFVSPQ